MVTAVIVAAGTGSRMGEYTVPKQFLPLDGVPILGHTLRKFDRSPDIDDIILVIREIDRPHCERIIHSNNISKVSAMAEGGKDRQESVYRGLQHAHPQTEIVLIHDAVRMFISTQVIADVIHDARQYGASIVAVPAKDTIKQVELKRVDELRRNVRYDLGDKDALFVVNTFERSVLWQVQTPQAFQFDLICSFHERSQKLGVKATDDAMLAEHFGQPVKIVEGSYQNIKITTSDDLIIAEAFLQHEEE
ncbi:2-C-methyl-D-erythritol 4-phosphate cytidylyltransferase [candidate division KSB3 bacterium]|uniref:2-C-methyl-D-erythritol 4-phosphate cytidylyltransferase n=1 Tax=candidate division KSB3 bacterium TaxID=2044937 RepID=A0A2G6KKW8_9BACT|nr:MAG: 2-C-methyl-D-erythritol 4-phosphate cytidylyltransferase [candidate division KSB3 bacterium]